MSENGDGLLKECVIKVCRHENISVISFVESIDTMA